MTRTAKLSPTPDLLRNPALHGAAGAWLSSALSSSLSSIQPPGSAHFPVHTSFVLLPSGPRKLIT